MPVAVGAMIARGVHVCVYVEASGERQPAHHEPERDQQTSADELSTLLESQGDLPPEKQHHAGTQREQYRMADGKSNGEAERARVPGRTERRCERKSGNRHEVIGPKAVKKAEREHRAGKHGGIIDGFGLRLPALGVAQSPTSTADRRRHACFRYISRYTFMYMRAAGDLYRLLGDEVRLRLLRVLAGKHGRL